MVRPSLPFLVFSLLIVVLVVVTGCTGAPATPTPPAPLTTPSMETSTPTPAPTPSPMPIAKPTPAPIPTPTATPIPTPTPTAPRPTTLELSQVKVASNYQWVSENGASSMALNSVINVLKETKTDFIFRGFFKHAPCPVKASQLQQPDLVKIYERVGYSFELLENALSTLKQELPSVIFGGSISLQAIGLKPARCEWNPKTGERIEQAELWKMATDPRKWGINVSKERLQYDHAKWAHTVPQDLDPKLYDWRTADGYLPDITNPRYQELLLSWAQAQIDAGADVIWIDLLFMQWGRLRMITRDDNHPAVKESHGAACKIVDEIHKYGRLKGKRIYVGSWPESMFVGSQPASFDYPPPDFDFITKTPKTTEVKEMKLDEARWDKELTAIKKRFGNMPVFAFIDWGSTTDFPLGVFSQRLSREEQIKFLRMADDFFTRKGVIFIYPIHGGNMGSDATILASGDYAVFTSQWDSRAPEFRLYDTIKELAQGKKQR